ncbi:oxysterol binding protein 5, putative [Entamoeba invadens IP1]|uniref:Oxysterol binding protein 5, putative n=1 Tax=Entamoeba invadens IP1 TaxID=370355 RepID=A0A0A1U7I1_ENTIV|nr:oxysterol binding protein 5, putative [Entamoeba invadens IP1]ELP87941.1 oxysterol binding protein 5, putative [Entamoeba invadens IP1]|eukprot:XP_004254712.1 oxysterol binding protein 5, putative [Entamoeba invadens IP1]
MSIQFQYPYFTFLDLDYTVRRKLPATQLNTVHDDLVNRSSMSGLVLIRTEIIKQWYEYYVVLCAPYILIFENEEKFRHKEYYAIINICNAVMSPRQSKMPGVCFKIEAVKKVMCLKYGFFGEALSRHSEREILFRIENMNKGKDWFDQVQSAFSLSTTKFGNGEDGNPTPKVPPTLPPKNIVNNTLSDQSNLFSKSQDDIQVKSRQSRNSTSVDQSESVLPSQFGGLEQITRSESFDVKLQNSRNSEVPNVLDLLPLQKTPITKKPEEKVEVNTPPKSELKSPENKEEVLPQTPQEVEKEEKEQNEKITTETISNSKESTENVIEKLESSSHYVHAENDLKAFFDATEEGKSIIWDLLKQVRPGMDLSRISFPSHILEPRSFLVKTTDYFSHIQMFEKISSEPDASRRMLLLVSWLLSGFYLMPTGIKKPYNPVLGETFRTMWKHPDGTHSYLIGEQVSHHPPISAFYASNRAQGWMGNGYIKFSTVFRGLSAGIILGGGIDIYLLKWNEHYTMTFPEALASGFFVGPMLMEIAGKSTFNCKESGYSAEITFNTRGTFSWDKYQTVTGKITHEGKEVYTVSGNYYKELFYTGSDKVKKSLLDINKLKMEKGAERFTVDKKTQGAFESDKLWEKVTEAIYKGDQKVATDEKCILEEEQRERVRVNETNGTPYETKYFVADDTLGWKYVDFNNKQFNSELEVCDYEKDYHIKTLTKEDLMQQNVLKVETEKPNEVITSENTTSQCVSQITNEEKTECSTLVLGEQLLTKEKEEKTSVIVRNVSVEDVEKIVEINVKQAEKHLQNIINTQGDKNKQGIDKISKRESTVIILNVIILVLLVILFIR